MAKRYRYVLTATKIIESSMLLSDAQVIFRAGPGFENPKIDVLTIDTEKQADTDG